MYYLILFSLGRYFFIAWFTDFFIENVGWVVVKKKKIHNFIRPIERLVEIIGISEEIKHDADLAIAFENRPLEVRVSKK